MGLVAGRIGRRKLAAAAVLVLFVALVAGTAIVLAGGGGKESRKAGAPSAGQTLTPTRANPSTPTNTVEPSPTPIVHAGILDGFPMSEAEWQGRKGFLPLAVMIDNTNGAYPHAGLDRADLVYEAFVEGGLTRLMAVYWRQDAEKVLPVRSARTPFVVWANEVGALYAHAGGAVTENEANAVGQIYEWGIHDLNAFSDVSYKAYYRDPERRGPYDLATSTEALREAAAHLGFEGPPKLQTWKFRDVGAALPPGKPAAGIEIDFQGRLYSWQYLQWKWDPGQKRYLRFQFGGPHVDAVSGSQLAFATVIVMQVPSHVVDEVGHVILDQDGSGPVTVFTGGRAFEGTWKKESREARTRFYDAAAQEIVLERGPIFVEVLGEQSHFAAYADSASLPPMPAYTPPPPGGFDDEPEPEPTTPAPTQPMAANQTPTVRPPATTVSTATPGTPARSPNPTVAATATPTAKP